MADTVVVLDATCHKAVWHTHSICLALIQSALKEKKKTCDYSNCAVSNVSYAKDQVTKCNTGADVSSISGRT